MGARGEPIRVSREVAEELGVGTRDGRIGAIQDDASVLATLKLLKLPLAVEITKWFSRLAMASNINLYERWGFSTRDVIEMLENDSRTLRPWIEQHIQSIDLGGSWAGGSGHRYSRGRKEVHLLQATRGSTVRLPCTSSPAERSVCSICCLNSASCSIKAVLRALDEIDGDLHVDIVGDILGWFQSRDRNPNNAQLLVTSHNVGLLDDLEKEEVFIVEKTPDGATRLHGAQDVRGLRRDARLYPKYRAGVLGGVPKIG